MSAICKVLFDTLIRFFTLATFVTIPVILFIFMTTIVMRVFGVSSQTAAAYVWPSIIVIFLSWFTGSILRSHL